MSSFLAVPSLRQFFIAHGGGIGERRIIKPFHRRVFRTVTDWMAGNLPEGKLNLYLAVPPGHSKTYIARDTIAYALGLWPDSQWIYTSYAAQLAVEQTYKIRNAVNSEWYRRIFKSVGVVEGTQDKFRTQAGGIVYGVGAGGAITGFRGGCKRDHFGGAIVIDDPLKADEARSETARKHLWEWFTGTLLSRKSRHDTPMLMIAQRLHPEDLPGMIKQHFGDTWHFLEIPAVDENAQTTIWPETFSYADAMRLKEVDPFAYWSQYQQEPITPGGSLIKEEWWEFYDESPKDIKRRCQAIIMTADTAYGVKDANDYSVVQCWGLTGTCVYLLDQIRGKWAYEELLDRVIAFWRKHSDRGPHQTLPTVDKLFIENKASGLGLLGQAKTFRREGVNAFPWEAAKFIKDGDGRHDKVARVNQAKLSIYAGKVFLPSDGDLGWVDDFIAECSAFNAEMTQTHDDAVDAMTMAVLLWQGLMEERT